MLGGDPGSERLIEYEAKLNYFLPENDALAICQYDYKRFSPGIIMSVIRTHPILIYRGRVSRNFYYVPPDEMLLPEQPFLEVERLLYEIFERETIKELWDETGEALRNTELKLDEIERTGKMGSWEWDAAEDLVAWSKGTYRIFGMDPATPPPDYEGHLKLYAPESAERLRNAVGLVMKGGEVYELELELARPAGARRWVIARGEAKRDPEGRTTGLRGTVVDITESKLAVEALYNAAPCGYHSLDSDGRFVRINDTELKWLGYAREEVVGKMKLTDVIAPESLDLFLQNFPRLLKTGLVRDLEFEFVRKDGARFPVLLSATAIKDRDGRFVMSNSIVFDITERKKAEDELISLNRNLSEAQAKVKVLKGLLPICASCKKIRNDQGFWDSVEKYVHEHSEAEFTHSMCPDCFRKFYPEFEKENKKEM